MSGDGTEHPTIPAGWYPDPADPAGRRWWDGARWTNDVQAPVRPQQTPVQSPHPLAPEVSLQRGAPLTRGGVAPVAFDSRRTIAKATLETGVAYTRSVWWLCAQPLWTVIPQVVIVTIVNTLAASSLLPLVLGLVVLNLVLLAIMVRLAFADRTGLLDGGNDTAASPWWTLLSPLAYLIARALEVRHYEVGGWSVVIWWSVAAILTPGVSVLAYFAVFGLVIP